MSATPRPWYVDTAPWFGLEYGVLAVGQIILVYEVLEKGSSNPSRFIGG